MNLRTILAAAILSIAGSVASAALINGAIDIGGQIDSADAQDLTIVDFIGDGSVIATAGDFVGVVGPVTMTDIVIATPGEIWSVGGFTFTATSFHNLTLNAQGGKDFSAVGILTAAGFDDTTGTFEYSSNSSGVLASFSSSTISTVPVPAGILLMGTALAGLGVARRRKKAA